MAPIVPQSYLCRHTAAPILVDGKLDDAAWAEAPWTADFVDIQGGAKPKPRFRTRAKLLWDDEYLYLAAELEEPHVWATLTRHDSVIFQDPDFEVFIDPDGDTHAYSEFEMNALNTSWDLLLDKPYMDQGKPNNAWDIPGLKTAVHVNGTLNNPADTDQGWTLEIAFPWKVLAQHAPHAGPPTEGEQWRIDFSRVEWQITTHGGAYQKVPHTPEDNWVWSPPGVVDMHRPEMWGLLQFTRQPPSQEVPVAAIAGKPARDLALDIYYAQRDFWKARKRWATNLLELAWNTPDLPAGLEPPVLEPTPDGYACSVAFNDGQRRRVWRIRQDRLLKLDAAMPVETETFIAAAAARYGDAGRRAAYFLVDNMPAGDRAGLSSDFLMENLSLALEARKTFPWATAVPERMFLNDVLPYASLDEPRDPWRVDFYPLASGIVRGCKTATEAAQALNRELFKQINVHYNLGRKRNNQSPKESIEQHKATCTGLAIILVDACRAVGVPARIAGVPQWAQKEGNHTWVEVWDGGWFFTGADEYDKNGLNHGWFNGDAAQTARSPNPLNQIYATSWRRTGQYFPLAWDRASREVPGVNVSARYAALAADTNGAATVVHLRLREEPEGARLSADVELRSATGKLLARDHTRAGAADLNDMPDFTLPDKASSVTFRFALEGQAREKAISCSACVNSHTLEFVWSELSPVPPGVLLAEAWLARPAADRGAPPSFTFTRDDASRLISLAWEDVRNTRASSAAEELSARKIVLGDKTLKWMEKTFGSAPDGKHSLWLTLHGGGQATTEENDRNWRGYYGRYEFPPAASTSPRAPRPTPGICGTSKPWTTSSTASSPTSCCSAASTPTGFISSATPRAGTAFINWPRAWPTVSPPPPCAPDTRTKSPRKACATSRFSSTWAARIPPTTGTRWCASSARRSMPCKRRTRPAISIASRFIPACSTTCRAAKPKSSRACRPWRARPGPREWSGRRMTTSRTAAFTGSNATPRGRGPTISMPRASKAKPSPSKRPPPAISPSAFPTPCWTWIAPCASWRALGPSLKAASSVPLPPSSNPCANAKTRTPSPPPCSRFRGDARQSLSVVSLKYLVVGLTGGNRENRASVSVPSVFSCSK